MDKSLRQQDSNVQKSGGFLTRLQIFDGILYWLTGLFQLTEEEQSDAGIYIGDQYPR